MFACDNITILNDRFEVFEDRSTKALGEDMQFFDCCVQLRRMLPASIMAFDVVLMKAIEDRDFLRACICQESFDIMYDIGGSKVKCNCRVHHPGRVHEVIVWVYEDDCCIGGSEA